MLNKSVVELVDLWSYVTSTERMVQVKQVAGKLQVYSSRITCNSNILSYETSAQWASLSDACSKQTICILCYPIKAVRDSEVCNEDVVEI